MTKFKINDEFWAIDVFMEFGTVFNTDGSGYGIIHDPDWDRKRRSTAKTKHECINDMIKQLEQLRDFESEY